MLFVNWYALNIISYHNTLERKKESKENDFERGNFSLSGMSFIITWIHHIMRGKWRKYEIIYLGISYSIKHMAILQ